jgi:hypothetical protein
LAVKTGDGSMKARITLATIRLSYVLELVMALAVGLALDRELRRPDSSLQEIIADQPAWVQSGVLFTHHADAICAGVVLVEGACLWVEFFRGRSPTTWGFGRLAWSVAFLVRILKVLEITLSNLAIVLRGGRKPASVFAALESSWDEALHYINLLSPMVVLSLSGLWITLLAAGRASDSTPDAREWSGRLFFAVLLSSYLIHSVVIWHFD